MTLIGRYKKDGAYAMANVLSSRQVSARQRRMVHILGEDRKGYIKRLTAAVAAATDSSATTRPWSMPSSAFSKMAKRSA